MQATSAENSSVRKQCAAQLRDPFELLCCIPFEEDCLSSTSSDDEATAGTVSTASSMHSCYDNSLISSCDPAASEFLLFALALQDQPTHQASAIPAEPPAAHGPGTTLTRTCAGQLEDLLPKDCTHTAGGQQDAGRKSNKQQNNQLQKEEHDSSPQH